jgi:hypothetical protein
VNDCGSVELCPSGLVTTTSNTPAGIDGVTAVSTEAPTTFTVGEATPPNVTDAPDWKLLPMTVTVVPPAVGPVDGERREIVGAATAGVEAGVVGVVAPPEPPVGGVESGGGGVVPPDVSVEPPAGGVESGGGVVVLPPVVPVEPPAGGVGSAGADTSYSCIVAVARALLDASGVGAESGVAAGAAAGAGSGLAAATGTAGGAGSAPCTNVGVAPIVSVTTGGSEARCCFAGRTDCGAN